MITQNIANYFFQTTSPANKMLYIHKVLFFSHVINHIIALVDVLNKKSYASNVIKFLITMEGGGDILSESKRAP